nr:hypothetical protein [uncultured Clostridium sp.]
MKELQNYSGNYVNFTEPANFSKELLVKLLTEWENAFKLVVNDYNEEFVDQFGEAAADVMINKIWDGHDRSLIMVMINMMKLNPDEEADVIRANELMPKFAKRLGDDNSKISNDMDFSAFSKDDILKLLSVWQKSMFYLIDAYNKVLLAKVGAQGEWDTRNRIWSHYYYLMMPRYARIAKIPLGDLESVAKIWQFHIEWAKFADYTWRFLSPDHAIFTVSHCPFLHIREDYEIQEFPCHLLEQQCFGSKEYEENEGYVFQPVIEHFQYGNILKYPMYRENKAEMACKWELVIDRTKPGRPAKWGGAEGRYKNVVEPIPADIVAAAIRERKAP